MLGRFLHHTPAEAMATPTEAAEGLRRTWRLACRDEGINHQRPSRLPLLFALDARLAILSGFTYALDWHADRRGDGAADGGAIYCASHIGGCGGDSGGCGGDSDGGDGGGDGGGGCGGD